MPFTEVVTQMPLFSKFLKEILSKKRRIAQEGVVNLTATCSAVIHYFIFLERIFVLLYFLARTFVLLIFFFGKDFQWMGLDLC